ncbi:MAG: hypothetical protein EP335_02110 [Alphaproteobacteria bacterium]|nr:MAG: hypothetical protein EP335_02110 [Alphaproteobacteria bacterium]
MSEHLFIEKRRRQRNKALVTTRRIFGLVALSIAVYGAFRFWIGNPTEELCGDNCGSMHSWLALALGFAIMFGVIIAAGAIGGVLTSLLRRRRTGAFTERYENALRTPPADDAAVHTDTPTDPQP